MKNEVGQAESEAMESLIKTSTAVAEKILFRAAMGNYAEYCSGIIILKASEAALGLSGQHGTGILLQHFKKTNTWSLPVAIRMSGAGFGIQLGAQTKNVVIFLNDQQLKAFAEKAVIRLGTQIGFSFSDGLEGDAYLGISDKFHIEGSSAHTDTEGWNLCISFQGNAISPMAKLNREMYGNLYDPRSSVSISEKVLLGATKTKITGESKDAIKALHETLNIAIEKKWIPKWHDDEEFYPTPETAQTA